MEEITRHQLVQQLGKAMSDVSEMCYYAGWMVGTENHVPYLCRLAIATGRPQAWGHGEVTVQMAKQLTTLASRLGCWADLDEPGIGYVEYHPSPVGPDEDSA